MKTQMTDKRALEEVEAARAVLQRHYDSEPPRVYRRVFRSKLRLLYQSCSGLHRRPPLLLEA